jgi:hypothetical protein
MFAITATGLTVKNVLLKPIISGLVHTEDLAAFIADLTTTHTGMDRFHKLLTGILAQYGGVELKTFKRNSSNKNPLGRNYCCSRRSKCRGPQGRKLRIGSNSFEHLRG